MEEAGELCIWKGRRIPNHPLALMNLKVSLIVNIMMNAYIIQKWQDKCEKRPPFLFRDMVDKSQKNSQNTSPVAGGYLVSGPS